MQCKDIGKALGKPRLERSWSVKKLFLVLLLFGEALVTAAGRYDTSTSAYQNHGTLKDEKHQEHHRRHHYHHQQQQQPQQQRRTWHIGTTNRENVRIRKAEKEGEMVKDRRETTCEDMKGIQDAVIRILNAQSEYDKGIDAIHDMMETLTSDMARLRRQVEDKGVSRTIKSFVSKSTSSAGKYSSAQDGAPSIFSIDPLSSASPSLNSRLDNLTLVVERQGHQLGQLEKRWRWMKQSTLPRFTSDTTAGQLRGSTSGYTVNKKTSGVSQEEEEEKEEMEREKKRKEDRERERKKKEEEEAKKEKEREREKEKLLMSRCEREMVLARQMTTKQRDINANVNRRVQHVEKMLEMSLQKDSTNAHSTSSQSNNGLCPGEFVRHLSSCYLFENATANWIDAEKRCQALNPNAHLVSIDTQDEEEFLHQYRSYNAVRWSSRYLWIGANDMAVEGRWSWVATGSEVIYTNWRTGEPSNFRDDQHCAYIHATDAGGGKQGASWNSGGGGDGRWDDWHCHSTRINFVCEIVIR